jgi:hypothetical protein
MMETYCLFSIAVNILKKKENSLPLLPWQVYYLSVVVDASAHVEGQINKPFFIFPAFSRNFLNVMERKVEM